MKNIISIPISLLNKIYDAFDNNFFSELIRGTPGLGKENDTHFIINTTLGINNNFNLQHINIFNNFVNIARRHSTMLQILKNQ